MATKTVVENIRKNTRILVGGRGERVAHVVPRRTAAGVAYAYVLVMFSGDRFTFSPYDVVTFT